ncbi:unnamed protein product [Oikopleura dioica]|uniref:Uncharacterized protein n=1 Tax=Oikopleura dioica TaxID=34765 RepID=E4XEG2_OIKDI|nr:unnamed protein product [Oikopleura dioica]
MCNPSAQGGKRTLQDVVHNYSVGLLLISIFLFITDLLVLLFWIFSFGLGMVVGIFGIATASMGISYSKIKKKSVFEVAYKKVMKMAWVTISFSFCIFIWIAVASTMFIENVVNVWGDRSYPLFWIGCCAIESCCYTEALRFDDGNSDANALHEPARDSDFQQIHVTIYQKSDGQLILKAKSGVFNPVLEIDEKIQSKSQPAYTAEESL